MPGPQWAWRTYIGGCDGRGRGGRLQVSVLLTSARQLLGVGKGVNLDLEHCKYVFSAGQQCREFSYWAWGNKIVADNDNRSRKCEC